MAQISATIGLLATLAQALAAPEASLQDRPPAQLGRTEAPITPGPTQSPRTPFVRLFAPATPLPAQPPPRGGAAAAAQRDQPRVVCGMVVVPVNSSPDPRMVKPVPSDVTFAMRVVAPPLCWD